MSSRLNDMRSGRHVIIMQRLHDEDLSGHVLKRGGYEHLRLPSEFVEKKRKVTSIGWTDPRKLDGELLFPALFTPEVLADAKKDLGSAGYSGQHQQDPVPDGGNKFKRPWFVYWEFVDRTHELVRLRYPDGREKLVKLADCRRFGTCDLAGSKKTDADWTVLAAWAVTPESDLILLDLFRLRAEAPEAIAAAELFLRKHSLAYLSIESNGLGLGIVQTLKRRGAPIRAVVASTDKITRSMTAVIRCEAGQIAFPVAAEWLYEFEDELTKFPLAGHDDQVDAVSLAAIDVFFRGGAVVPPEQAAEAREKAAAAAAEVRAAKHRDPDNPMWWRS
jgi:predicted phage terminase large subunit-like protein